MSIPIEQVTEGWWFIEWGGALSVVYVRSDGIVLDFEISGHLNTTTRSCWSMRDVAGSGYEFLCKIPSPDEIKARAEKLQRAIDTFDEIARQSDCNAHKLAKEWLEKNEEAIWKK